MSSLSGQPTTVFAACAPVRCPQTSMFDLDAMLRASTGLEDDELERLDSTEKCDGAECTSNGSSPREDGPDKPSPAQHSAGRSSTPLPGPSRPPGSYQHRFRKRKREEEILAIGHVRRPKTLSTLAPLALEAATACQIDYVDLPATDGAYGAIIGKSQHISLPNSTESPIGIGALEDRVFSLQEVQSLGVKVYPWDGINPVPFVDGQGQIFMVLAGRPTDQPDQPDQRRPYSVACEEAYNLLEQLRQEAHFSPQNLSHRRGDYPVINVGVTHGMGTVRPTYLNLHPNVEAVERVLASRDIQRIASYGSSSYALWFPKNYAYYKKNLDALFEHTGLRRIFPKSVFPSAALNCGPDVCTKRHTDGKNCPFGVCTVTALGRFNPKTGGHLVLWELGIAVEFPPGSTILLPSATISHSNTTIVNGEVRASFTQYASGGLFRWVDYGFQTEKDIKKKQPRLHRELLRLRPDRWRIGVSLYSTIAELRSWLP